MGPVDRQLATRRYENDPPCYPAGAYVIVSYGADFTYQQDVEELVVMRPDEGVWRPERYIINAVHDLDLRKGLSFRPSGPAREKKVEVPPSTKSKIGIPGPGPTDLNTVDFVGLIRAAIAT